DQRVSHGRRALSSQRRLLALEFPLVDIAAQTERGLRVIRQPRHQVSHLVAAPPEELSSLRLEVQLLHGAIPWTFDRAPRWLRGTRRTRRTGRTRWPRDDGRLTGHTEGAGRSGGAGRGLQIPLRRAADLLPVDVDVLHVAIRPRIQRWAAIARLRAAPGRDQHEGGDRSHAQDELDQPSALSLHVAPPSLGLGPKEELDAPVLREAVLGFLHAVAVPVGQARPDDAVLGNPGLDERFSHRLGALIA